MLVLWLNPSNIKNVTFWQPLTRALDEAKACEDSYVWSKLSLALIVKAVLCSFRTTRFHTVLLFIFGRPNLPPF